MSQALNYDISDFKVKQGKETGDLRVPYIFESKDGRVKANFFWENDNVKVKGVIWDGDRIIGSFGVAYPFANRHGGGSLPKPEAILSSITSRLKRGEYEMV